MDANKQHLINTPPPPLMGSNWNPQQQQNQWQNVNWSQYYNYYNQLQTQQTNKNAPPGFGNAVVLNNGDSNDQFPPLPSGPGPIRFNLNQNNRYNPMQHNPLESPQNVNEGFISKNQKKKNRKKAKQAMLQAPTAPIIGPAPFVAAANKVECPPPPTISAIDFSRPPPPLPESSPIHANNSQNSSISSPPSSNTSASSPFTATTPSSLGSTQNPTDSWPDSLNNFVNRCYAKCKTKVDKDQIDIILKGKITSAASKGALFTTDWDGEPTPSVHSDHIAQQLLKTNQPILGTVTTISPKHQLVTPKDNNSKKQPRNSMSARLGIKSLAISKSRSKSPRKRRSRSSDSDSSCASRRKSIRRNGDSSDDAGMPFTNNGNKKLNGIAMKKNKNKQQQKLKQQKQKKGAFYSAYGTIGGDVDGDKERLQQRAARFKQHANNQAKKQGGGAPLQVRNKKLQPVLASRLYVDDSGFDGEEDFDVLRDLHIVGTCKDLEKSFLRLTKAPSPTEVRSPEVLIYSLQNVKSKWLEKQDYYYACDQLKSIRQDLTVSLFFCLNIVETLAKL